MKNKFIKNILGITILEGLISTAIVGIGFIAILQMVNYSVQSIDVSGERTKANYLVSMIAEDIIGHRDSIYGISATDENIVFDGGNVVSDDSSHKKFADHLAENDWTAGDTEGPCGAPAAGSAALVDTSGAAGVTNIYEGQEADAPRNKEAKWREIFDNNRFLKCKGENDIKKLKVYKICRWADECPYFNDQVFDNGMYIGRIQINTNGGKKRKFLYFQADYIFRE